MTHLQGTKHLRTEVVCRRSKSHVKYLNTFKNFWLAPIDDFEAENLCFVILMILTCFLHASESIFVHFHKMYKDSWKKEEENRKTLRECNKVVLRSLLYKITQKKFRAWTYENLKIQKRKNTIISRAGTKLQLFNFFRFFSDWSYWL
jgi:hypothetical protein